jgi:inosine-uridine nucleoside N-ribohydrolase
MSVPTNLPGSPIRLFIDTDMGVDDAVAVAWLLAQPSVQIVGFSSVSGAAAAEHVAANLLTLLDVAGRQIPVTVGASAPLVVPPYHTGLLVHGPDGFWGAQAPHDSQSLPHDAPAAIAAAARANPGLTILALGPLTNLALAVQRFPQDLAGVRLIALGGASHGGNTTPLAEFNAYADPHALAIVLDSPMQVDLIMRDAFDQIEIDAEQFVERLGAAGGPVGQLLARVLVPYIQMATLDGGRASIPDAAAAIYALRPDLGTASSALVQVITEEGHTRGLTIVANTMAYRVGLIASPAEMSDLALRFNTPGFDLEATIGDILQRRPDNARVVLDVDGREMVRLLEQTLAERVDKARVVGQ